MAKRVPYEITDEPALRAAYPELFKDEQVVVTKTTIDKETLYKMVKLNKVLGRSIPGIKINADQPAEEPVMTSPFPGVIVVDDPQPPVSELSAVPGCVPLPIASVA